MIVTVRCRDRRAGRLRLPCLVLIGLSTAGFTAAPPSPPAAPAIDSASSALARQDYEGARRILRALLLADPANNDALYLIYATRQTQILDYESYTFEESAFIALSDSVMGVLRQRLASVHGSDSLRCLFYLGNCYGGKSLIFAKNGRWMPAVKNALKAIPLFGQVTKADPRFLPAYLGTGIFRYYLGANLRWVPVVGAREREGIADIRGATAAPFPYSLAAKNSLCWILIDKKEYSRADSIAGGVLNELPDQTIFLRIRMHAAMRMGRVDDASACAARLIAISGKRTPANWSDLASGYAVLAVCYERNGSRQRILPLCKEALALKIPPEYLTIPYVQRHLKTIEDYRAKYAK